VLHYLCIISASELVAVRYDAVCCRIMHCVAACCSLLQLVAACCSVLQCVAMRNEDWMRVALSMHLNVLQRDAVCCSVLQYVAEE